MIVQVRKLLNKSTFCSFYILLQLSSHWILSKSDCKHYAICLISMFISLLVFVALHKCFLLSILCCVVHNMPDFGFDCWRKKKERTQKKAQKTKTVIKIHFLLNMKIALSSTQYIRTRTAGSLFFSRNPVGVMRQDVSAKGEWDETWVRHAPKKNVFSRLAFFPIRPYHPCLHSPSSMS